jgi:hypothetical protein
LRRVRFQCEVRETDFSGLKSLKRDSFSVRKNPASHQLLLKEGGLGSEPEQTLLSYGDRCNNPFSSRPTWLASGNTVTKYSDSALINQMPLISALSL